MYIAIVFSIARISPQSPSQAPVNLYNPQADLNNVSSNVASIVCIDWSNDTV